MVAEKLPLIARTQQDPHRFPEEGLVNTEASVSVLQ